MSVPHLVYSQIFGPGFLALRCWIRIVARLLTMVFFDHCVARLFDRKKSQNVQIGFGVLENVRGISVNF